MTLATGSPASVAISDAYGRVMQSAQIGFDGTPVITETAYDEYARVDALGKPYLYNDPPSSPINGTVQYDVLGRAVLETAPGDSTGTITEYLGFGSDTSVSPSIDDYASGIRVTNDKGQTSSAYYDVRGLRIAAIEAAGVATRYEYDAHGNLLFATVNADSATEIVNTFDILGRKLTMDDPEERAAQSSVPRFRGFSDSPSVDEIQKVDRWLCSYNVLVDVDTECGGQLFGDSAVRDAGID
jgi:YD repeat-containing protein